ncbi:hypothetical protein [Chondrinema litorale]|uniref:hypothetical protein n=1 Tax=Chondrinema litorale TaxID=2994555 RepID=UPI002542D3A5|nr:hypothetical protein [Chondrinema litorale]UZR97451.1 hypothetical protein OQ292_26960 [Chondrinema litorale]
MATAFTPCLIRRSFDIAETLKNIGARRHLIDSYFISQIDFMENKRRDDSCPMWLSDEENSHFQAYLENAIDGISYRKR